MLASHGQSLQLIASLKYLLPVDSDKCLGDISSRVVYFFTQSSLIGYTFLFYEKNFFL